jgi:hypothetical protein
MPRHFDPQRVKADLNLAVIISQVGQDLDQSLCGIHVDVCMEYGPPDLKRANQAVIDEKVFGQNRSGIES